MSTRYSHLPERQRRELVEPAMPNLFDPPPPPRIDVPSPARTSDPETSKAVALRSPIRRGSERYWLLVAFSENGALTDDEAGAIVGIETQEARRRCVDLRRYGLIEPTGTTRPSAMGNPARVCRITSDGHDAIAKARQVASA